MPMADRRASNEDHRSEPEVEVVERQMTLMDLTGDASERPSEPNSVGQKVHRKAHKVDHQAWKIASYQWLSKSSKRRVRKGVQKQLHRLEQRDEKQAPDAPQNIDDDSLEAAASPKDEIQCAQPEPSVEQRRAEAKRLAQWRKRKLKRGTDPFTRCYGKWHHFTCGHRISVLCDDCSEYWTSGPARKCHCPCRTSIKRNKLPGLGWGHVGGPNLHFRRVCPQCKYEGKSLEPYKIDDYPKNKRYPHWTWWIGTHDPVYLEENEVVRDFTHHYLLGVDFFHLEDGWEGDPWAKVNCLYITQQ